MDALLAALGLKQGAVISGLLGALVSFRFFKEMGRSERLFTVASGVPAALYCGPWAAEVFNMGLKGEIGITFLIGALGITALSAVVKAMPELIAGAREKWLSK